MTNDLIPTNSLMRAAERVRAAREAERTSGVVEIMPPKTERHTSAVRARLNFIPDADTLSGLISNALSALSRGVRWARGSIVNLLV
jgi:hypothetical protein